MHRVEQGHAGRVGTLAERAHLLLDEVEPAGRGSVAGHVGLAAALERRLERVAVGAAAPDDRHAPGLVGVPTWFWLEPAPLPVTTFETAGGIDYKVVAQPETVDWDFGDGGTLRNAGFGVPYPAESAIQHRYGVQSEAGYRVAADTRYSVSWWWRSGSTWLGPYPLGSQTVSARDLSYAVRQAQPELEMAA